MSLACFPWMSYGFRCLATFLGMVGFLGACAGLAHGQTPVLPRKTSGRQAALLIGVEKYQKVPELTFVGNDVARLGDILRDRGGFDDVVELSDRLKEEKSQPVKANLMQVLPEWLKRRGPNDTVVVYFSGHGFRDADGAMYLAPLDIDPDKLKETGVPVAWFRDQIANCKAAVKLLILDACHAGSTKGMGAEANLGQQDLAMFEKLEGVVTLASSTGEQPSQIWEAKEQSLFTYWLNQGLKGHADEDGNGAVNIDELYKYVFDNVTQTAKEKLRRPQTPVRKIGLGTPGTPVMVYLKPQGLKQLLAEMAEQLADALGDRGFQSVGVLEFTSNAPVGELLGGNYGLLGKLCAGELEAALVKKARNRFKVIDRRMLQQALARQQFEVGHLGDGSALKELSVNAGGMPVVAVGMLHDRTGRVVSLRCQLLETQGNGVAAVAGGNAWLTESEWAMTGKSVSVTPEDRRIEIVASNQPLRPQEDAVVERLDKKAEGPHPLASANSPYRIWLMVDGKERKGTFRGNDYYVPLKKGEVYEIWVENHSKDVAIMRLLVDGLNTRLEADGKPTVEVLSEEKPGAPAGQEKGILTQVIGKPVSLDDARAWVLDPSDPKRLTHARETGSNPNLYAVRGFVTKNGKEGEVARFTVVDASESLAARHKFSAQIGLITAAFYSGSVTRSVGTVGGERIGQELETVKATVGQLLTVIHIHYYDPSEGTPDKPAPRREDAPPPRREEPAPARERPAAAKPVSIPLDAVPAAVKESASKAEPGVVWGLAVKHADQSYELAGKKTLRAPRERPTGDGDVEMIPGDVRNVDVRVKADGQILFVAVDLPPSEVPPAVLAAAKAHNNLAPQLARAMRTTTTGQPTGYVLWLDARGLLKLLVSPDGKSVQKVGG